MRFQKSKDDMVCVSCVRTPFGRFGGSLRDFDVYDLGALAMRTAMERIKLDPAIIDEVWWGVGDTSSTRDPYTPVTARQSLLKAGISARTPSVTFDQACISGMNAAKYGLRSIQSGEAETVLSGGATSFSTIPFLLRGIRWEGRRHTSMTLEDPLIPLGYKDFAPVAVDAGEVAVQYAITRLEQDEFACASHENYGKAWQRGFFKKEIEPLELVQTDHKGNTLSKKMLDIDEQYRSDIRLASLTKLKPIYGSPTCTAGNAPGMNDGATAQIFMKRAKAEALGHEILYTVVDMSTIAMAPGLIGVAPAFAIKKCLDRTELDIQDMRFIEINEAFACVPLVSSRLLSTEHFLAGSFDDLLEEVSANPIGGSDDEKYLRLKSRLNANGGAVAVGHPNTATGARLMMTAAYNLKEAGGGYAACGICGGLAQGAGCIIWVE